MDNNNLQQPQDLPTNQEATPIADGLKNTTPLPKKKSFGKLVFVIVGLLAVSYGTLTVLYNYSSLKLSAVASFVPNLKKQTTAPEKKAEPTTAIDESITASSLDTTVTAADTMSKDELAKTNPAEAAKPIEVKPQAKKTEEPKKEVASSMATKQSEKIVTKPAEKKEPATVKTTVAKKEKEVAPTVILKKEKEKSASVNIVATKPASTEKEKVENGSSEKISSAKTSSKKEATAKSKFVKKNDDYAVYHTDNSYTIPAGQISSSKEYPTYNYKTNTVEPTAAKHSTSYVSYNTSEASFIKASKPYPKNFEDYLKSIANSEIDYDTRFAFSERCLQTYFVPGAQAQQVDETGKVMNSLSMEELFGYMRVNGFAINVKEKQQSGSRLSGIKFAYKF